MRLSESDRETIEHTLDALWLALNQPKDWRAHQRYLRAIAIVRERPGPGRRIRSDFQTRRPTPQADLPIDPVVPSPVPDTSHNDGQAHTPVEAQTP